MKGKRIMKRFLVAALALLMMFAFASLAACGEEETKEPTRKEGLKGTELRTLADATTRCTAENQFEYEDKDDPTSKIIGIGPDSWVFYKQLDLGTAAKSMTVTFYGNGVPTGSNVSVYAGAKEDGTYNGAKLIAQFDIVKTSASPSEYIEKTIDFNLLETVSGKQDVLFVFKSPKGKQKSGCITSFMFGNQIVQEFDAREGIMASDPLYHGDVADELLVFDAENGTISNTQRGSWVYYSNVDFGDDSPEYFEFKVKGSSDEKGRLYIYIDAPCTENNDIDLTIPAVDSEGYFVNFSTGNDPDTWETHKFKLPVEIGKGKHSVTIKFSSNRDKTMGTYKDFRFYDSNEVIASDSSDWVYMLGETVVKLDCTEKGTKIYYTLDNTTPTESSSLYDPKEGIVLNSSGTIKAISVSNYGLPSVVTSIDVMVSAPIENLIVPEKFIDLDDKESYSYVDGWPEHVGLNKSCNGTTLSIGGSTKSSGNKFEKGCGLNTGSEKAGETPLAYFRFKIPDGAKQFFFYGGIDDSQTSTNASGAFWISFDEAASYAYQGNRLTIHEYETILVDIPDNATEITVYLSNVNGSNACDNMSLCNAGWFFDTKTLEERQGK